MADTIATLTSKVAKLETAVLNILNALKQVPLLTATSRLEPDELIIVYQGGEMKRINLEDLTFISKNGATPKFDKTEGTYIGTAQAPITTLPIVLSLTDFVNGGFVIIWYKGAVITKDDFSGGTPVILDGVNTADVLCRIFIDYHETSGSYSASIQTGFTGELPASLLPAPMTSFQGAQSEFIGGSLPAPMTSFAGAQSELGSTLPAPMTSFAGAQSDL